MEADFHFIVAPSEEAHTGKSLQEPQPKTCGGTGEIDQIGAHLLFSSQDLGIAVIKHVGKKEGYDGAWMRKGQD